MTSASAEPSNATTRCAPSKATSRTPGSARELLDARSGARELDLEPLDGDLAQALERVDDHQPPAPQDRDAVCDPLDLGERVRGEKDGPSLRGNLPEERVEALLNQRIEPRDRLVENQQLGLMHERLDQAELLAVARRQLAYPPVEVGVEPLCERVANPAVDTAAELGQVVQHRRAAQHRIEGELAGQEAHPPPDLQAVRLAVEPEQRRRPGGGLDQVEQQPHRG